MRIREAPQLPVVGQISRSHGDPRFEQQIQVPCLLKIFQVSVAKVAHQSVNVERKPFSDLIPAGTHKSRGHVKFLLNETLRDNWFRCKQKTLLRCAHVVKMWERLWRTEENRIGKPVSVKRKLSFPFSSRAAKRIIGDSGILFSGLTNNLQKRLRLGPQRTMTRMDHIQASSQRFSINNLD
jgi:hypothetical protein